MSKSLLYAANMTAQTLTLNSNINFGSVVRRYGQNIAISGGNIAIAGPGYYSADTNITLTADGAGTGVITLYNNGAAIPGASVSFTASSGSIYAVSIPAVIRLFCCNPATITAEISGIPASVSNASIQIIKE